MKISCEQDGIKNTRTKGMGGEGEAKSYLAVSRRVLDFVLLAAGLLSLPADVIRVVFL